MNKISCDICLDLLPLIKDGIGSEDSRILVEEHILECKECKDIYEKFENIELREIEIDNEKVLAKIRNKLYSLGGLILILGTIVGVSLIGSQNTFYNLLIIPLLGGVSYIAFDKKAYIGSILVFLISFINQWFVGYIDRVYTSRKTLFYGSLTTGIIFLIFFYIGIIILKLFKISISREVEDKDEKTN